MTGRTIPAAEWTEFLDGEYLSEYIPQGGSAVKFAVCEAEAADRLATSLLAAGARRNYAAVTLRAEDFRAHMPQDLYCQIAAQLDWRGFVRERILRLAADASLATEEIATVGNDDLFGSLTKKNRITRQEVVQEVQKQISAQVYRRRSMTRNFRVAMTELCRAENATDGAPYTAGPVLDWLTGREKRASVVRPFFIYGTIDRTTARGMFESTLHWAAGLRTGWVDRAPRQPAGIDHAQPEGRSQVLHAHDGPRPLRSPARTDRRHRPAAGTAAPRDDGLRVRTSWKAELPRVPGLAMRIMNDVRDEQRQNRAAALVNVS